MKIILWGDTYDEDYDKPEDILDIQSRIARSVADELKIRITPEERELIDKIPTSNLSALNFYQRGKEIYQFPGQANPKQGSTPARTRVFQEGPGK